MGQSINRNDYEIIVINDGSKDLSNYALGLFDEEITLIENEDNQGLPSALNSGIRASNGDFIVRVDSDDYVNRHFLLMLYEYLYWNSEIDAIACDYLLVDDNEDLIERKNCDDAPIGCGIMFKKNQLFKVGLYDEEFKINEEIDLKRRFEKKYKIERLQMPLYRYRKHEHNMTNNELAVKYHDKKLREKHKLS
tara:strand:+ start:63 stop:641 length:579 start_codon:yes stop_codon:yes gene_type:complete